MATPLAVEGLAFAPNGQQVFQDITIDVAEETTVGIIGPNGSGKSTILRIISNQTSEFSGKVSLAIDSSEIVYMPQDYRSALFPWLTTQKHVELWSSNSRRFDADNFQMSMQRFDLRELELRRVGSLSGGEQQMLLLSLTLALKARLFMLDEPLSAVDVKRKECAARLIKENRAAQILVTHDLFEAARLTDKCVILGGAGLAAVSVEKGAFSEEGYRDKLHEAFGS